MRVNRIEFFMPMHPPRTTHQQKKVNLKTGRFYEPPELKQARAKLTAHLGKHAPKEKLEGAIRLYVKWCFKRGKTKKDGEYKITRPDTDNLQKLLKDCMTDVGFWKDDAQVACEIVEKFWAELPGIYVSVEEINNGRK